MYKIKYEYIWLDGNQKLRGKTRIVIQENNEINPSNWNYDGSSTYQAVTENSEVILKPVRTYKNPFNNYVNSYIVLCETWTPDNKPHPTNTRYNANNIFNKNLYLKPLFGIEQEFFVFDANTNLPLGITDINNKPEQGQFYCGIGAGNAYGRDFLEEVENHCISAELGITGKNYEVAPGQMEVQIMNEGIKAADDLIILKYIMGRVGEKYNYIIDYSAKPLGNNFNGSGCHINFSTEPMRNEDGYDEIIKSIEKLALKHEEHLKLYGDDNHLRLTGKHETSSMDKFTYGVADRSASIRIPRDTYNNLKGYFEDRRPSSSCDHYIVTSKIFETSSLS